jgi:hypothetical protein
MASGRIISYRLFAIVPSLVDYVFFPNWAISAHVEDSHDVHASDCRHRGNRTLAGEAAVPSVNYHFADVPLNANWRFFSAAGFEVRAIVVPGLAKHLVPASRKSAGLYAGLQDGLHATCVGCVDCGLGHVQRSDAHTDRLIVDEVEGVSLFGPDSDNGGSVFGWIKIEALLLRCIGHSPKPVIGDRNVVSRFEP